MRRWIVVDPPSRRAQPDLPDVVDAADVHDVRLRYVIGADRPWVLEAFVASLEVTAWVPIGSWQEEDRIYATSALRSAVEYLHPSGMTQLVRFGRGWAHQKMFESEQDARNDLRENPWQDVRGEVAPRDSAPKEPPAVEIVKPWET